MRTLIDRLQMAANGLANHGMSPDAVLGAIAQLESVQAEITRLRGDIHRYRNSLRNVRDCLNCDICSERANAALNPPPGERGTS